MSTTSKQPFAYPPMHGFPPFFTLQRNAQTLASQLTAWSRLVLDYCRHYRVFVLDSEGAWQRREGIGADLFRNQTINRQLNDEAIRIVFKAMVEKGEATWEPPLPKSNAKGGQQSGNSVLVFWHRPEEWGEMIANWIYRTGQNGSIMTFYELTEGELVQNEAFVNLPLPLLRLALTTLEKKGKARVFEGTEASEGMAGVKFT